jgi:hypothetical protein
MCETSIHIFPRLRKVIAPSQLMCEESAAYPNQLPPPWPRLLFSQIWREDAKLPAQTGERPGVDAESPTGFLVGLVQASDSLKLRFGDAVQEFLRVVGDRWHHGRGLL